MPPGFLLTRVLLRFEDIAKDIIGDLSAVAMTPDGSLWVGSDELLGIERLSPTEPFTFANHQHFFVGNFVELFNQEDEIDIESMDYANNYLWLVGSHSTKRKKPKGKGVKEDLARLSEISIDLNRYLLARIPVVNGELVSSEPQAECGAACLAKTEQGNQLMAILAEDPHLAPLLSLSLPSKDNGLDIEGLAVAGNRIFFGLRGPVLRGWAIIIELEVAETQPGILEIQASENDGKLYKKHFLDLNGLGIRDLCWQGEDLIILAGATMTLDGALRVFRLRNALDLSSDSLIEQDACELEVLFDLPTQSGQDYAEGLALFPCFGQSDSLLVVYDSPALTRKVGENGVFADVFQISI